MKKIILIILLILIIAGIAYIIIQSIPNGSSKTKVSDSNTNGKIDIIMQDNQFITQINDIYYNFDEYKGKTIQIEGFPMVNGNYKFVGRYGPGCCNNDGYAYLEYQYSEQLELIPEKDWIRVTGTLKKGNDDGTEYIYIDATSIEKLETRGLDRVTT